MEVVEGLEFMMEYIRVIVFLVMFEYLDDLIWIVGKVRYKEKEI